MRARLADTHPCAMCVLPSMQAGWHVLRIQVEPVGQALSTLSRERCGETSPLQLTLMVVTYGTMHLEWRQEGRGASWQERNLQPGDVVLYGGDGPAYDLRCWGHSEFPLQRLELHLSRELVAGLVQELADMERSGLPVVEPMCWTDPLLTQLALELHRERDQPTLPAAAAELFAEVSARLIALQVLRHSARKSPQAPPAARSGRSSGLSERQLTQVLACIQANLEEALSVEQLAQQVGFSPHHFALVFRRATGASPHQFVLRQRLARAQQLLQESTLSLAQIASACGFSHQSHLTRVFQQHLGCTPSVYRQSGSSAPSAPSAEDCATNRTIRQDRRTHPPLP